MTLRPFFSYYGGKWRLAPHYAAPTRATVIEPFAGAAGYATRHPQHQVRLYDTNPVIVGVWDYLIHVPAAELRRLPATVAHVDDHAIPQEAKWLIGFWIGAARTMPGLSPSAWMRRRGENPSGYWGQTTRDRLAAQVDAIRHWRVTQASVFDIPNHDATWFVDPPYQNACGQHYKHKFTAFPALGDWCRARTGHVIVCEQEGADWLPFEYFRSMAGATREGQSARRTTEVIWTAENRPAAIAAAA